MHFINGKHIVVRTVVIQTAQNLEVLVMLILNIFLDAFKGMIS